MLLTSTHPFIQRPRNNRKSESIRTIAAETRLNAQDLIAPLFIVEGVNKKLPIPSLPGIYYFSIDQAIKEAQHLHEHQIPAIALFPVIDPSLKDYEGSEAWNPNSLIAKAITQIKTAIPSLCIIADIALDPFTSHGHDGLITNNTVDNDRTLEALVKQSTTYIQAGCDILAPSDMMDGRVKVLREALPHATILSYAVKYASTLYQPFRTCLGSSLSFGDKKTYQMNPANQREAIREALLDEAEGADMLMVKPALSYLDVLSKIKEKTSIPVGGYHVSGEYAMVMIAAKHGLLDAQRTFYESLTCIKRGGADFIFTYASNQILPLLN